MTWEPPVNNGGTEITGYVVEKKLEFMPKWEKVYTLEPFVLEYTFENLKEKTDYIFRVFAENSVGLSAPATTETVKMRTHASKWCTAKYQKIYLSIGNSPQFLFQLYHHHQHLLLRSGRSAPML